MAEETAPSEITDADTHQSISTPPSDPPLGIDTEDDDEDFSEFLSQLGGWGFNEGSVRVVDNTDPDETGQGELPSAASVQGEGAEDDLTPGDNPPAPPVTGDTIDINGVPVPLAEVTQLYEFGKAIRENGLGEPATGAAPGEGGLTPPPPVAAAPTPPPIPDYIDQDDAVQMGLWNELQSTRAEIASTVTSVQSIQQTFYREKAQQDFSTALSTFRTQYPTLTEADIETIRLPASKLVDPLIKSGSNPIDAMTRAMYIASIENPATRDRMIETTHENATNKSRERKQKLSSLSGTSGSAPRTPATRTRPTSDQQARDEFASALAESFGSNGRLN